LFEIFLCSAFEEDAVHDLFAATFGEIFFQWAVMSLLAAGTLQPRNVSVVLCTLEEFFVVFYGNDYRNGLAVFRDDFKFAIRTHAQ